MQLRRNYFAVWAAVLLLTSSADSAEPDLKAGVRLSLDGSRLLGWAAPDVVDWNNDGLNDIVVGHYSGALFIYLNRGLGKNGIVFEKANINRQDGFANGGKPIWAWRFNKANCVCPGPGRISPRVVDWDNDGKKDFVIGDGRGAQTRIWKNIGTDGSPSFSTHHIQYLPPDAGIRPYVESVQPCIADWNGDGSKDLIMGRNRGVYVYLNEGSDDSPKFDFNSSRLGTKIRNVFPSERLSPAFVDWDADGKKDLLVGSQQGGVWFARNVGSSNRPEFDGYTSVRADGKAVDVRSEARIAVADLDNDGRDDLVVGDGSGLVRFFQASNPNPVARSGIALVKRGGSVQVDLVGTDDAGRPLTYTVLTQPKHGTLTGTAPKLTYTPKADFEGQDQFTFKVAAGELNSAPATVTIDVQPTDRPPTIEMQPTDALVGLGQAARFQVFAAGTPQFSYQWKKNGKAITGATKSEYAIRETKEEDNATFSVTIKNAAGSVSSRKAALQVKPLPSKSDDVPVVDIKYKSPVIEPATPGVLTLIRTGNISKEVSVLLTSRRGHNPVIADIHYVPLPSSIKMKAGQTTAEIKVTPIDDTLVNGKQTLRFMIVPNPAYRIASKFGTATMTFLDDDCPHVGITAVKDESPDRSGVQIFKFTAEPAPRRDTEIAYSVGGTAIGGVDYETLTDTVTIPAGETFATVAVKPYKPTDPDEKKTVVLTLPSQPFTYFDFYRYLNLGKPRTASVVLSSSVSSSIAPKPSESPANKSEDSAVEELRNEVSRLGWIVFTAKSSGPSSDLDLFVMRPDGSHLRNITNTPKFDEYDARVSSEGKKILYRRSAKTKRNWVRPRLPQDVGTVALRTSPPIGMLVIANSDGSDPKPLGVDGAYAWASWGPAGKQIACLEEVEAKEPASNKLAGQRKVSHQIVIRDADSLNVVKTLPSAGIHSQAIWSPDGKRICGPANIIPGKTRYSKGIEYPLGIGKMVSLDIESGRRMSMARFPDWGPVWATDGNGDWFQGGSPHILHSANNYGICPAYYAMLWRSGLEQKPSELVFGEFKKHIWSGCTSPDDKYAIFVIGGEAWPLLGKMAIIRLADAPIARGSSPLFHEVLSDHFPNLKQGPVLDLPHVPEGFEPHWTMAEIGID